MKLKLTKMNIWISFYKLGNKIIIWLDNLLERSSLNIIFQLIFPRDLWGCRISLFAVCVMYFSSLF